MQCRLRDRRSRLFSLGLRPCPLRTEIPPDSLNLLIMLCTVEGEISKSLPIFLWGTLFLNISIIFSRICWQTGDPRPIFAPKGLDQGSSNLILEGRCPAEFSSNLPQHTCLEVWSIPSKTLISCFRCVWLGLELNSAGHRPSRTELGDPWTRPFLDAAFVPNDNYNHLLTSTVSNHIII